MSQKIRSGGAPLIIERPWRYFGRWFMALLLTLVAILPPSPTLPNPARAAGVSAPFMTPVASFPYDQNFGFISTAGTDFPAAGDGSEVANSSTGATTFTSGTTGGVQKSLAPTGIILLLTASTTPRVNLSLNTSGVTLQNLTLDLQKTTANARIVSLKIEVSTTGSAGVFSVLTASAYQTSEGTQTKIIDISAYSNQPNLVLRFSAQDVSGSGSRPGILIDRIRISNLGGNGPVVPTCSTPITTVQGVALNRPMTATDGDGTVSSAMIGAGPTPAPSPGTIGLAAVTPASGPGGVLTATVAVSNLVPPGDYNLTITFANNDAPTPQTAKCTIAVKVLPPVTLTPIYNIQGAARQSSLVGSSLATQGVVTGRKSNGFFIQDGMGDGLDSTSDGIFVFTGSPVPAAAVLGNSVLVSATVAEYVDTVNNPDDAPLTELKTLTAIYDLGPGPTITPIIISTDPARSGPNLRRPPLVAIFDPTNPAYNPAVNGVDFYETLEGMLVEVDNGLVVGNTSSFGEIVVVPDGGLGVSGLTSRKSLVISASATITDFNPERVIIEDEGEGIGSNPKLSVGDAINAAVIGPLDYTNSNFRLQVLAPITAYSTASRPTQESIPPLDVASPGQLRIASYNLENFIQSPTSSTDLQRVARVADHIKNRLGAPDLLILIEIQDDSGATSDGVVTADTNLGRLRQEILNLGGPAYSFKYVSPLNNQDGGQPGGNIRQAFFFRTDRGLAFVNKTAGNATTPVSFSAIGGLNLNPGRISPSDPAFSDSRKPLAGEFVFNDQRLIVIGNHFNSRIGDQPLYGANQPPTLSTQVKRSQQAQIVRDFVTTVLTADPTANVIVAGDLNEFEFGNPLAILKNGNGTLAAGLQLANVIENPALDGERYTYQFEGNSQVIDHILYSPALSAKLSSVDIVHFNADYLTTDSVRASDHDPVTAVFEFGCNAYVVTQNSDTGSGACGSLSYALNQARVSSVPVEIRFNVATVNLSGLLPVVTNTSSLGITIRGGCTPDSAGRGVPGVRLNNNLAVSIGLTLTNSIVITGLKMTGFNNYALDLAGSNNRLECSWLGTADGINPAPNGNGLRILAGANNNTLGRAGIIASGNLLSANLGDGLRVEGGTNNMLYYTRIGYRQDGGPLLNGTALRLLPGKSLVFGPGNGVRE